ncbi:MAG: OmpA family protein, partial [Polyangiaceae bacterium]|nr:OmpA family protein [Polyangiaceae bacterium]
RDGFEDHDGIPDPDNDGDGFLDEVDACPMRAEDLDGIMDDDGCPEDDADEDRVPDHMDRCPLVPGTLNPSSPECAGCPELACLRNDGSIEIRDRVEFEFGTDRILESSAPVLLAVRDVIHSTPSVRVVRIEGHTDSVGRDSVNMRLSRERAASVRRWLIDNGVDSGRLAAFGCGEAVARRSNSTEAGRQENRRVEFHVTDPAPAGGARDSDVCEAVE